MKSIVQFTSMNALDLKETANIFTAGMSGTYVCLGSLSQSCRSECPVQIMCEFTLYRVQ